MDFHTAYGMMDGRMKCVAWRTWGLLEKYTHNLLNSLGWLFFCMHAGGKSVLDGRMNQWHRRGDTFCGEMMMDIPCHERWIGGIDFL